jgi:tetratricopeptide (TPR) repeat protein
MPTSHTIDTDSRELRIFLSSTFRDFQAERARIMEKIFPALRRIARARAVELTLVDLRWGLTDEKAELGGSLLTCLREVEKSRPYFIGMLGERYGWTPERESLQAHLHESPLAKQIHAWLDEGESITAMEMRHGVFDCPEEPPRAYFYLRTETLTQKLQEADADCRDVYFEADPAVREKQQHLRARVREGALAGEKKWHLHDYDDLDHFEEQLKADLLAELDRRFPEEKVQDTWALAERAHRVYAKDRLAVYIEPTDFIDTAFETLTREHRLVLTGPSGMGKSSAVAALVQRFREQHPTGLVIEHYPGAAPGSRPSEILLRAIHTIKARLGPAADAVEPALIELKHESGQTALPSQEDEIIAAFPLWLARIAHAGIPTLLALDALNQVDHTNQKGARMGWLPHATHDAFYFLVSGIPSADTDALGQSGWPVHLIPEMAPEHRKSMIGRSLEKHSKQLTDAQETRLAMSPAGSNPLYLKVLLEELLAFGQLSKPGQRQDAHMDQVISQYLACTDIPLLYEKLLERLEKLHGKTPVCRFLSLLAASRDGLTEAEILGISKGELPFVKQAELREALDFHLSNRDGLHGFAHQALEIAVKKRYPDFTREHAAIADYFEAQHSQNDAQAPLEARTALELPWQLKHAGEWARLKTVLAHPSFFDYYTGDENHVRYYVYGTYWRDSGASGEEIVEQLEAGMATMNETAKTLNNVAIFLRALGHYAAAEPLSRRTVAITEKTFEFEHLETVASLHNLASLLQAQGNYEEAELLYRRALTIHENAPELEYRSTAICLSSLASLLQARGNYEEAEPLSRGAAAILEKALGEHPDTATGLNNLAALLKEQGNYGEAEPLLRRALAIREKVLEPEHPRTASSLNNLASLLQAQGNYEEAEHLYRRALAICDKVLEPEHPDTATSLSSLASLLYAQRRCDEAEPLLRRALAIREKALEPEHPETATSLNDLAVLLYDQGNYGDAEPLFRRALAIREKVLEPEHPDTATSLSNLASLLQAQGNYEEAELLYRCALAIRDKVLEPEHPDTATSLNNLASLLQAQGNYEEAKPLFRRALAIREKVLEPEHPDTATSLNNLASLLQAQGHYEEAEPLYRRALAIRDKVLEPEHPDTATSLNNLAWLFQAQGNYEEAEPLYRRALAIREKVLEPEHPHTAISLSNLAWLFQAQGHYEEAEPLYRRALAIREKVLEPEHPKTVVSLSNLASLLQAQGNYEEAELLYRRALAIRDKVLEPEHPDTASSLIRLALLLQARAEYDEAELLYRRALGIYEKISGPEYLYEVMVLNHLATLLQAQGKHEEAESLYRRALAICESAFEPEHPYTVGSLSNLASLLQAQGKHDEAELLRRRFSSLG